MTCSLCDGSGRIPGDPEDGRYSDPCPVCTTIGEIDTPVVLIVSETDAIEIADALHAACPERPVTAYVDLLLAQHRRHQRAVSSGDMP